MSQVRATRYRGPRQLPRIDGTAAQASHLHVAATPATYQSAG